MARAHEDPFSLTAQTEDQESLDLGDCKCCYLATTYCAECDVAWALGLHGNIESIMTANTVTDLQPDMTRRVCFLQKCIL